MFKRRITEMFITYGNILLVFKHYIFQSKPCLRNTKSLFYNIVEIHRSYKNKLYSFQKCCALLQSSCTVCVVFFFLFVYGCLTKHNHTEPSTSENLWRNPRMWRTGRCTHYWWLQLGFPGIDEAIHGPIPNMFWFTFWHKTIWRP